MKTIVSPKSMFCRLIIVFKRKEETIGSIFVLYILHISIFVDNIVISFRTLRLIRKLIAREAFPSFSKLFYEHAK